MTYCETDFRDHPVALIPKIVENWGKSVCLEFAIYTYIPQQEGLREIFHVAAKDVTPEWLKDRLTRLQKGQEIALQSRIRGENDNEFHIGMLDFALTSKKFDPRPLLHKYLGPQADQIQFYRSGKSYHGYVIQPFSDKQLIDFWAKTILCEEHRPRPIIDTRWIGHRMISGYGSLRWSCHTKRYNRLPYKWDFDRHHQPA